jgi:hypothetical protein
VVIALRSILAFVLLLGFSASGQCQPPFHTVPAGGNVDLHASEVTLPLKLSAGRPVIALTIDGKGPFDFIFDTGAQISVVDPALAAKLRLEEVGQVSVGSPAHRSNTPSALFKAHRVAAGALEISGLVMVGLGLPFSEPNAPKGVLSPAQFAGYLVTFDYPHKHIVVTAGSLPEPDGSTIFAYAPDRPVPALPISVAGKSMDVDLDLGSSGGLTLPSAYAGQLSLNAAPVPVKSVRVVEGKILATAGTLKGTLAIGRYKIEHPRIVFADVGPMGSIGAGLMHRFAITLDIKDRRIRLTM